jgi:aminopeptidase
MTKGAWRLGEADLVPHCSHISKMGILFYTPCMSKTPPATSPWQGLRDLRHGRGVIDGRRKARRGVNDSLVHVVFLVGTGDMNITGITKEGEAFRFL